MSVPPSERTEEAEKTAKTVKTGLLLQEPAKSAAYGLQCWAAYSACDQVGPPFVSLEAEMAEDLAAVDARAIAA